MLTIKNAKIYTMVGDTLERGDLILKDGKIQGVGEDLTPIGKVVDAKGQILLPGLIDCHSHIGGMNFSHQRQLDDTNEMTAPLTPEMDMRYGTDTGSPDFELAYRSGITTLGLTPGSGNVICGTVFASKTFGTNIFDMTIKHPVALKVALGGNPTRTFGSVFQTPATRMSIPSLIRDYLKRGIEYQNLLEEAGKSGKLLPFDRQLEPLLPVLRREIPLKIHCTQYDMLTAIEIAREFNLKFSIEHAWGATEYLDELVESGADIVFGPIGSRHGYGEFHRIDIESVVELDQRGVRVALTTDAPLLAVDALVHHAGEAVRAGLPVEKALEMITINPARILGVQDRVGSIEVGKDADLVLFDAMPALDARATVKMTIQDGEIIYQRP